MAGVGGGDVGRLPGAASAPAASRSPPAAAPPRPQDGCDAGEHGGGEREPRGAGAAGEPPNGLSAGRAIKNPDPHEQVEQADRDEHVQQVLADAGVDPGGGEEHPDGRGHSPSALVWEL